MEGVVNKFPQIGHLIFEKLNIVELLRIAECCKAFYVVARSDCAWKRHKERVLHKCPMLEVFFDVPKRAKTLQKQM
jgi:hypothetical protein